VNVTPNLDDDTDLLGLVAMLRNDGPGSELHDRERDPLALDLARPGQ
jgi:hypothetical protein